MNDFTEPVPLRIGDPADLPAIVPYLLGFHPDPNTSLVVIVLNENENRFLVTGRLETPAPGEAMEPVRASVARTAAMAQARGGNAAVLVGYGSAQRVTPAIASATAALQEAGILVRCAVRVADGRFFRVDCDDPTCCPPDGVPFDPSARAVAASAVVAGMVALPDRQALADTIAPVTGAARVGMVAATVSACQFMRELVDEVDATRDPDVDLAQAVWDSGIGRAIRAVAHHQVTVAAASYRSGQPVDDEHAGLLTVLLDVPGVLVFAARRSIGQPAQIEMWSDLVRRAEPAFVAAPACLLVLAALQKGNGVLAHAAVSRALQAEPDNPLALLLAKAVYQGIHPDEVTRLLVL